MERLTMYDAICGYEICDPIDVVENDYSLANYKKVAEKLGEYEDLEEQGLLLRLPCKPGDTLYCMRGAVPTRYNDYGMERWLESEDKIIKCRVVSIKYLKGRKIIKVALKGKCFVTSYDDAYYTDENYEYCTYNFSFSAIGKTVFLTREEAEPALAEMKGEK